MFNLAPMFDMAPSALALIFIAFCLGGLVKGVSGMGLPTVAMGLLATVFPPAQAASLLFVPTVLTNAWQLATGPSPFAALKRFWPMVTANAVMAVACAGLLASAYAHYATVLLGVVLLVYAVFGLSGRRLPAPAHGGERWMSPAVGLATGALTGGTGVSVMPAAPYLQSLGLDKEALVQAMGLSFTVSTLGLGLGLWLAGGFAAQSLTGSALALIPAAIGMAAGQALRRRVSQTTFKKVFFVGLLALGAHLALGG
ncbi:sulfite exporter TauE/SafE family protein [Methylopila sp. M107]|uniref:sulfite exporter TauE/SafE family protein n=1 Tax=Methylopila sp. M107 TaxID=1101190 RepID=UPI00036DDEEE|nr:sulfite exporter TauE/SafE family protein [Methylopila sp. M107]